MTRKHIGYVCGSLLIITLLSSCSVSDNAIGNSTDILWHRYEFQDYSMNFITNAENSDSGLLFATPQGTALLSSDSEQLELYQVYGLSAGLDYKPAIGSEFSVYLSDGMARSLVAVNNSPDHHGGTCITPASIDSLFTNGCFAYMYQEKEIGVFFGQWFYTYIRNADTQNYIVAMKLANQGGSVEIVDRRYWRLVAESELFPNSLVSVFAFHQYRSNVYVSYGFDTGECRHLIIHPDNSITNIWMQSSKTAMSFFTYKDTLWAQTADCSLCYSTDEGITWYDYASLSPFFFDFKQIGNDVFTYRYDKLYVIQSLGASTVSIRELQINELGGSCITSIEIMGESLWISTFNGLYHANLSDALRSSSSYSLILGQ